MHLLILVLVCGVVREWLGIGFGGKLWIWTTPVEIILSAVVGFTLTAVVALLLQKIPKIGKYIMG
jgi:hypothetical protein